MSRTLIVIQCLPTMCPSLIWCLYYFTRAPTSPINLAFPCVPKPVSFFMTEVMKMKSTIGNGKVKVRKHEIQCRLLCKFSDQNFIHQWESWCFGNTFCFLQPSLTQEWPLLANKVVTSLCSPLTNFSYSQPTSKCPVQKTRWWKKSWTLFMFWQKPHIHVFWKSRALEIKPEELECSHVIWLSIWVWVELTTDFMVSVW